MNPEPSQMVQLCSRHGTKVFKGDIVPLRGGMVYIARMRQEKSSLSNSEWWLEDGNGNRVPDTESSLPARPYPLLCYGLDCP